MLKKLSALLSNLFRRRIPDDDETPEDRETRVTYEALLKGIR